MEGQAILPPESARLEGLAQVNRELVAAAQASLKLKQATLDIDATIIKSAKREALRTYEGCRGYQPWVAVWAEANLVVADQFREGNVPACFDALAQIQATLAGLPPRMGALRPTSLRFRLLNVAGRIIEHGRRLILRLPFPQEFVTLYEDCRDRLWALAKARAAPSQI